MNSSSEDLDQTLLLPGFLANAIDTASGAGRPKSQRVLQVCAYLNSGFLPSCLPCLLASGFYGFCLQVPQGWTAKKGAQLGTLMHVGKALGQGVQVSCYF